MSAMSSMSVMPTMSVTLSTKFEKELAKFIAWVETTDYKVSDIVDGSEFEWKNVNLENFEEPGRNKLETYIKELMKVYFVSKGGEEINDIKLMTKEFRKYKPKRSRSESEGEKQSKTLEKKQKTVEKKQKTLEKKQKTVKKSTKTLEKNVKSSDTFDVVVSESVDTNDTWYLQTLSESTRDLVTALGNPIKNSNEDDYEYEWKIRVGGKMFSIYNWLNYDNEFYEFQDNEWYLAGSEENSNEEKYLMDYIKCRDVKEVKQDSTKKQNSKKLKVAKTPEQQPEQQKTKTPEIEAEIEEEIEPEEEQEEIEETEEVDIKESNYELDVELDLIEDDDLEINIDDIDFDF